jgi:hypothetical protein
MAFRQLMKNKRHISNINNHNQNTRDSNSMVMANNMWSMGQHIPMVPEAIGNNSTISITSNNNGTK